jgi:hypothetical protein
MKKQDMGVIGVSAVGGFMLAWTVVRLAAPCVAAGTTRLPPEVNRPVRINDVEVTFKADKELYLAGDTPGVAVTARRLTGNTNDLRCRLVATATPAPNMMMRMMPRPAVVWSNDFTVTFEGKDEWIGNLRLDRPVGEKAEVDVFSGSTNDSAKLEFVFEDWVASSRVVVSARMKGALAPAPVLKTGQAL